MHGLVYGIGNTSPGTIEYTFDHPVDFLLLDYANTLETIIQTAVAAVSFTIAEFEQHIDVLEDDEH